jgi:hypothetical protein
MCELRYNWPSWRWLVSLTTRTPFLQARAYRQLQDKWLCETEGQCGRCWGEKCLLSLAGIEPRFLFSPAHSLVTIQDDPAIDMLFREITKTIYEFNKCPLSIMLSGKLCNLIFLLPVLRRKQIYITRDDLCVLQRVYNYVTPRSVNFFLPPCVRSVCVCI